jgi:hypothetical protein
VFDGDFFTRWGRLRWMGSPNLQFETRSGNTAKPDRTWTAWKKLESVGWTGADGEGQIASFASRYVQYKVALPDKGSTLKEVTLFYLPQNQRPRVTDVYLAEPAGLDHRRGGPGAFVDAEAALARGQPRQRHPGLSPGLPAGERGRLAPAGRPRSLTKPEFDWNTDSVPDGLYLIGCG